MTLRFRAARTVVVIAAVATAASACSSKATSGTDAGSAPAGAVKTGVGVTADTIKVGVLTDLSGPIAPLGKNGLAGSQLFFEQQNAKGGVCGRKIDLVAYDNKYNVQNSVSLFPTVNAEVIGLTNFSGAADVLAVQQSIKKDKMVVLPSSYDSSLLSIPTAAIPGSPYDIETINGISYLVEQKKLAAGDTLAVIHYPTGIGQNVLSGARAAGKHFGVKVVEQEVAPSATDVTAQVNAARAAGAKVIVMGTAGNQTVAAASVVQATGYDATLLATNLISAAALATPAKDALLNKVVLTSNTLPLSSDNPAAKAFGEAWKAKFPDTPVTASAGAGYVFAQVFNAILEKACDNKDLTRDGLISALRGLTSVDSGGLQVDLDFSKAGQPASRSTNILKPDADAFDGVKLVQAGYSADFAKQYQPGS
ncbi:ABC-type branched-chain amino acid transport system, substrate-binding protein [Micromonospora viridifaciens]|uniref:ABC-type branched-chain amino acid transport system, substrate-binding protein n=1 Tax=Micromonospora viridifaciens TaxID=1881 RepID=A0A1C4YVK5_MICVI|nr:ABC transporter substrate-binding protein [Micromonospora viridifaciens]SCF24704.1 ABC-type branched-chain amino acid transport system, substrate-binding protein [Micromonospora viridifaciens]